VARLLQTLSWCRTEYFAKLDMEVMGSRHPRPQAVALVSTGPMATSRHFIQAFYLLPMMVSLMMTNSAGRTGANPISTIRRPGSRSFWRMMSGSKRTK